MTDTQTICLTVGVGLFLILLFGLFIVNFICEAKVQCYELRFGKKSVSYARPKYCGYRRLSEPAMFTTTTITTCPEKNESKEEKQA